MCVCVCVCLNKQTKHNLYNIIGLDSSFLDKEENEIAEEDREREEIYSLSENDNKNSNNKSEEEYTKRRGSVVYTNDGKVVFEDSCSVGSNYPTMLVREISVSKNEPALIIPWDRESMDGRNHRMSENEENDLNSVCGESVNSDDFINTKQNENQNQNERENQYRNEERGEEGDEEDDDEEEDDEDEAAVEYSRVAGWSHFVMNYQTSDGKFKCNTWNLLIIQIQ